MKKIAILSGGPGLEQDVARKSAVFFKKFINRDFDYYDLPNQLNEFIVNKNQYEKVIPVFHGEYGEDGKIFAFLEILGIPHSFSTYDTHSICLDKYKSNILVDSLGVDIPEQFLVNQANNNQIGTYPVIVKPNKGGSSFHTYKVDSESDFEEKITLMKKEIQDDILVQDFIIGDEYSVPMVNGNVLPIMMLEKSNKNDFFDFESKYENETRIKEVFPIIEETLKNKLISDSKKIYKLFGIKGFCRVDFLVRNNKVYFLEVNTIPGMTEASILPKSWKLTGKTCEELIEELIK